MASPESQGSGGCIVLGFQSRSFVFLPREEMSQAGSISRNLLLAAYMYGQVPGHLPNEEVSGMTDPMVYFESTGLLAPPISLVFNYIQTGGRSVFRSFNGWVTKLRKNTWARRLLARRNWVSPTHVCEQVLPFMLLLLLLGVVLHLILPK
ncbi:bcl-2-interacting killer isoform 4-T4 [Trichechus inunguis]